MVFTHATSQKSIGGLSRKQQLWLQAVLDGELPSFELRPKADALANSVEGQRLLNQLRRVKSAVSRNETDRRVRQSRRDYWSRIQRAILKSGTVVLFVFSLVPGAVSE